MRIVYPGVLGARNARREENPLVSLTASKPDEAGWISPFPVLPCVKRLLPSDIRACAMLPTASQRCAICRLHVWPLGRRDEVRVLFQFFGASVLIRVAVLLVGFATFPPLASPALRDQSPLADNFCRQSTMVNVSSLRKNVPSVDNDPAHYSARHACVDVRLLEHR